MHKTGLVLGKFMPLHKGHVAMLQFAGAQVEQLFVVVDHIIDAPITAEMRCAWVQKTVPGAIVLRLPQANPQDPSEHPDFWNIWRKSLLALLPGAPDIVVASESYGTPLAEVLGATFVPFDPERTQVPISATQIRRDLYTHWAYLSDAAKPDCLMRICLFGPESTGKTTLASALAEHFHTVSVPEYARQWIETYGDASAEDMLGIAQGQLRQEEVYAAQANRLLFCDTDPLMTKLWHRWLFGYDSAALESLAKQNTYDLYLLTDTDIAWQEDAVRYFPANRQRFLQECQDALEAYGRPYRLISGQGPQRLQNAVAAVQHAIAPFFAKKWR